jgi:hypothetical protein
MKWMIILLAVVALSGCCRKTTSVAVTKMSDADYLAQGYTKVTVTNMSGKLDGCKYLLFLADGSKLEPVNLAEDKRVDGLQAWIKYEAVTDMMSICMAGKMVRVSEFVSVSP